MVDQYVDPMVGTKTGAESSLSNWAGPYVTEMLGKGQALADTPYQAYGGPLTAGASGLQQQAFSGLAGLTLPTPNQTSYAPQTFTAPGVAQSYMSPYMQGALTPQMDEARRSAEIQRVENAGRLGRAGAYGGSRQAVMESEGQRNLQDQLAKIYGTGMQNAFESGQGQFNTEEARRLAAAGQAQQYGLQALGAQQTAGGVQRGIESEGIAADYGQFKEERDYPYKQVQYMQSLLQGLPVEAQSYNYMEPSGLNSLMGGTGGFLQFIQDMYKKPSGTTTPETSGTTTPENY
jgi:hypothetical protein